MIARIWKGAVPTAKAADYLDLMRSVSLPDYRAVEGNAGAWCLHRHDGDLTHITMLTFWTDMTAITRFAGSDPNVAKYYPFDPAFLIEMTPGVEHHEMLQA
jgi:hypothetical protein